MYQHILNQLVELTPDEYLQFLIASHFANYREANVMLSVYDVYKRIQFNTRFCEKIFSVNLEEIKGLTPRQMQNQLITLQRDEISTAIEAAMDYVLNSSNSCSYIVFSKYNNIVGALHVRIDPVYTLNQQICGLACRGYDFTDLLWGIKGLYPPAEPSQALNLKLLSDRQKQVLFLLAIDFTQDKIAQLMQITRGSVSRMISQICAKLNLTCHSGSYLVDTIGRKTIITNLELPDVAFRPLIIRIEHDLESIINKFTQQ